MDGTRYHVVYCDIITGIYSGRWKKGDRLPNLEELCEKYNIGRNTARAAVSLLEENGYIVRRGRRQPEICFDWENEELRAKYLKELVGRKQTIGDVFEFMVSVMPELFGQIILLFDAEKQEEIVEEIGAYRQRLGDCNEQEISDGLIRIYLIAISFIDNRMLRQLFQSLYYYIQVPVENETRRNMRFKAAILFIKQMMKKFQSQIYEKDAKGLERQIRFFCENLKNNTTNYLNRICKGIPAEQTQEYVWIPETHAEYMDMTADLLMKVSRGVYRQNDLLPSYAQLAREGDVSEKTSRCSVRILNEWKVVTTVNGVGSRVNGIGEIDCQKIIQDEAVRENIRAFFEALQIFILTCRPVIREYGNRRKEAPDGAYEREFTYEEILRILFTEDVTSVVKNIYTRLMCILKWGSVLEICGMKRTKITEDNVREMRQMLCDRAFDRLAESICGNAKRYFEEAEQFWSAICILPTGE